MLRIAVDLTPIQPGGENGGAKIFTLQLIKNLSKLAPQCTFLLLASETNYAELEKIKATNIKVIRISQLATTSFSKTIKSTIICVAQTSKRIFKSYILKRLKYYYLKLRSYIYTKLLAENSKIDLLFCPFTAPFYHALNVPIVSTVYDLQVYYYPFFFSEEEEYERKKHFKEACDKADKIVCISDFVRDTVLQNSNLPAEKVKTVHINLAHRLPLIKTKVISRLLKRFQLKKENFLLFPANFWLHKNHQMLITAFSMYRKKYPQSSLQLVCTGADSMRKVFLLDIIKKMDLAPWIIMPGFLADDEFTALLVSCKALIFPSLYEGFGMPVIEAMAYGKPVLCSNVSSLPEIAGAAAIYFNPKKPTEIVQAIESIDQTSELTEHLATLGKKQAENFSDETSMATKYLKIFYETAISAYPKKTQET